MGGRWQLGSIPQKQPGYTGWQSQRGASILGALLGIWGFAVPSLEPGWGEDRWPGDAGAVMGGLEGAQHLGRQPGAGCWKHGATGTVQGAD